MSGALLSRQALLATVRYRQDRLDRACVELRRMRENLEDEERHVDYLRRELDAAEAALAAAEGTPLLCEDCGMYPADLPSRLCPGCEAYRQHTGAA